MSENLPRGRCGNGAIEITTADAPDAQACPAWNLRAIQAELENAQILTQAFTRVGPGLAIAHTIVLVGPSSTFFAQPLGT